MSRHVAAIVLLALTLALMSEPTALAWQATPAAADCPVTSEAEHIEIARVWYEEVINLRNPAALRAVLDPEVVHYAAGYPEELTIDEVGAMMDSFLAAFPHLRYEFDMSITQDDFVMERYTATGPQDGPLGDLPASGRTATWTGIDIFRIECGNTVEVWSEGDALSRNAQLVGEG